MKIPDDLLADITDDDERAWLAQHLAAAPPLTKDQRNALAELDRPRRPRITHAA